MTLKVKFINNRTTLIRKGRPAFLNSVNEALEVDNDEDRRHILHGATQISDVLITSFNWIVEEDGEEALEIRIDEFLEQFKMQGVPFNMPPDNTTLEKKIEKVITIAFSKQRNLIIGSKIENQGIEKARKSISVIRREFNKYCQYTVRSLAEIKAEILKLININLKDKATMKIKEDEKIKTIAIYRVWILQLLRASIEQLNDAVEIIRILADFEFSCTVDIIHDFTTKEDNIWGITMANRLQNAICRKDKETIFEILL